MVLSLQQLSSKLEQKQATIGIDGLGYVGLPLLLRYCEVGFKVVGFDIDPTKVDKLNAGTSYISHIDSDKVATAVHHGFQATSDFSRISAVDAIILCVPTPLNSYREPDLSYIISTLDSIIPHCHAGQVLSLESTTYPGTTEEIIKTRIEQAGLTVGKDFFLLYSPEREDPANPEFTIEVIPKVCGGSTKACLEIGKLLYGAVVNEVVAVSSTQTAEMTKLLENIHRAVNIGLVNELKMVADRMGIDIHEVIRAASTKPFGFVPYYPGPGIGGHCIPVDPFYLTWKAREVGIYTRFIALAGEINANMPRWVISKLSLALNEKCKAVKNSKILLLGLAYKKNVDDVRESPTVEIIELLLKRGAIVEYSDPHVASMPKMRAHHLTLESVALTADNLKSYDAVVLATDHDAYDYDFIQQHADLIIDTRGVYASEFENIVKA